MSSSAEAQSPSRSSARQTTWIAVLLTVVLAALVVPPLIFLLQGSLIIAGAPNEATRWGLENFQNVLGGRRFVGTALNTLAFAAGSAAIALVVGWIMAWIVERTNAPLKGLAYVTAIISLGTPYILYVSAWLLVFGKAGPVNQLYRTLTGASDVLINIYSMPGMVVVEGFLWSPLAFLLVGATLRNANPELEEAARVSGAGVWATIARVTMRLSLPAIMALSMLVFIRAIEAFEVPALVGLPGRISVLTTDIYTNMMARAPPDLGGSSALSVLMLLLVLVLLYAYARLSRHAERFATITGKGFRPSRIDLGKWKIPCALWVLIVPLSLCAPLLLMLWASLLPLYTTPSLGDFARMSLANYAAVATRDDTVSGIWNSLLVGTGSASAVAAATFVLSWVVVRRRQAVRWLLDVIVSLPLVFPGIVLGIAVLVEFLNLRFIPVYGTLWIVIFALGVKFLPYGMRFSYSSLLSIDRQLEESARMCGAGTLRVLRSVVLPLTLPAIVATWIYVFMNAIRDLSTAVLLSGANNAIVSVVILNLWDNGEVPQLAALSILIVAGVGVLGVIFMKLATRHNYRI